MADEFNKQIGNRIQEKREQSGLTRDKLAENIGISPQFLAQIELGNKGMSLFTLVKICKTLSVSADYILLGKQIETDSSRVNELISNLDPKYLPYAEELIQTLILAVCK